MLINHVVKIDQESFEDFISTSDKIVYITAPWCEPCKALAPIVNEIASEHLDIKIGKLDAGEYRDLAISLGVRNVPTFLFYRNGEIVDKTTGGKSKSDLSNLIDNTFSK